MRRSVWERSRSLPERDSRVHPAVARTPPTAGRRIQFRFNPRAIAGCADSDNRAIEIGARHRNNLAGDKCRQGRLQEES